MSLAEDLRRSFEATAPKEGAARAPVRRTVALTPRAVAPAPKAVAPAPKVVAPRWEEPVPVAAVPVAADDSLSLLDRAAKSIVYLLGRYRQLEEHVRQLDAWSKAQIQAAETAATRWQEASAEAERKAQEMQKALEAATKRAEVAEQAIKRDHAALSVLQERIIAAFGFGSEAHDALSALDID